MRLLGWNPECGHARCRDAAAGYVTDETANAWLCRKHLKRYEVEWRAIGRTLGRFLEPV